ncbi:MAG: hypothetical protein ACJA0H_001396 [Francisellaceae bacterium]|jgi:hypothetical protein
MLVYKVALSDAKIKALKLVKSSKQKDIADGNGLYIRLKANGSKTWIFRYSINSISQFLIE